MERAKSLESQFAGNAGPIPMWQSSSAQCALCSGRRRDYLFVVGQARMTRCHECGLLSRTGTDGEPAAVSPQARSYRLDGATELRVREQLASSGCMEVLEVLIGTGES